MQFCGKWPKYVGNGLSMASMCGEQLKNLRNGLTMQEMT